jgi:hypothetical protein
MQRFNLRSIPEESWSPYPGGRKVIELEDHIVIVPEDFESSKVGMGIFCEVCELSFSSPEDSDEYKRFGCCSSCANAWAYSHREKWIAGWRPSPEQVKTNVQKRIFANKDIAFV